MKIQLTPYTPIENQNFDLAEIVLTQDIFQGLAFVEGKMVLSFVNCNFNKVVVINETDVEFKDISLIFSYCLIKRIEIATLKTKQVGLHFHGCIIEGNIKNKNLNSISLNNCITPSLFLQDLNKVFISFTEENIFIKKWIRMLKYTDFKSISELLKFKQSVYLNHVRIINIQTNHNKTDKIGIYRDSFRREDIMYHLSKEQKDKLNINISVDFSKQEDELLKIDDCILNSLSLTGIADGKVSIENTKVNNIYIHDFTSQSETLLYNVSPYSDESKFEIRKSNMDNCWFDNIDFIGYTLLSFYRSRFAKASFTSCNFPQDNISFEKFKTLENIHYPDKKPQNYFKDQYETFLQLRKSLENSGNYYEAQKLGAISKESLRKISSINGWDRFILWVNKVSNNHGLSIKRPFVGLLFFSILLYILYLLSIGRIFTDGNFDWTLVGHYFSFLDLTHRKNFLVSKEEFTFWTLTIDFIHKILVGFLIFQFVSAFRKYVKK